MVKDTVVKNDGTPPNPADDGQPSASKNERSLELAGRRRFDRGWTASILKLVAIAAVLLAASTLAVRKNGLEFNIDRSPLAKAAKSLEPYDLEKAVVLKSVIFHIKREYVEPERIDPARMLLAGLNAIQVSVPPVMIDYTDGAKDVKVRVGEQVRTFGVADVKAPWHLDGRFEEIFSFLQGALSKTDIELRKVEYAAVNGMLRTLDPHTILLTPEMFEDMRTSTSGQFAGLGVMISLRDGFLTVVRPLPGTPAEEAGLQRGDRIVKIEDESTLNMPINDSVERLRGAPASKVTIWIQRKQGKGEKVSYSKPKKVVLTRAIIRVGSVKHRMLGDGVGYVSVTSFQGNTFDDLKDALRKLRQQNMKGLVLDLRGNPGGLLDQAVKMSDLFLTSGSIVATAANARAQDGVTPREEEFAKKEGTEPNYPLIVLVDGMSASASEIVAGALKNHDRALIVGERTFGKGSVQVLHNFRDSSALKITIAHYLTPGDRSIQGVGIVPDVAVNPITVDEDDMDLEQSAADLVREADLSKHLTNKRARDTEKPTAFVHYYLSKELRKEMRQWDEDEAENETEKQFLLKFARTLLKDAKTNTGRRMLLRKAGDKIAAIRGEELDKARAELKRLGVDWSDRGAPGSTAPPPFNLEVSAKTNMPDNRGKAGEDFRLTVEVRNTGKGVAHKVWAVTESDNGYFDGRELVFGKIPPGQKRTWTVPLGRCTTKKKKTPMCAAQRYLPPRGHYPHPFQGRWSRHEPSARSPHARGGFAQAAL